MYASRFSYDVIANGSLQKVIDVIVCMSSLSKQLSPYSFLCVCVFISWLPTKHRLYKYVLHMMLCMCFWPFGLFFYASYGQIQLQICVNTSTICARYDRISMCVCVGGRLVGRVDEDEKKHSIESLCVILNDSIMIFIYCIINIHLNFFCLSCMPLCWMALCCFSSI